LKIFQFQKFCSNSKNEKKTEKKTGKLRKTGPETKKKSIRTSKNQTGMF
jgi:hypothetical protein